MHAYIAVPLFCRPAPHFASGAAVASVLGMILVPGIRAGLNDRSQSAYAAPIPNPVPSAIGHARPVGVIKQVVLV